MGTCPTSPELCVMVAEDRRGVRQGVGRWEQKYWVWFRLEEKPRRAVDAGDSHLLFLPQVSRALHRFEPKMQLLALPSALKWFDQFILRVFMNPLSECQGRIPKAKICDAPRPVYHRGLPRGANRPRASGKRVVGSVHRGARWTRSSASIARSRRLGKEG